ncbi:hypothetical protein [Fulvivirga lutea]|uniref:Uncharacterized protein n=1 Tax=Fulvivirga lutea TaxID=2810512 RepID=A0A974WGB7_9BACT|nr:hypothetical protein [Fulvivirga lutea]QSE97963.1 hypothetical protein JR347_02450 [Fulvivirga lutea]
MFTRATSIFTVLLIVCTQAIGQNKVLPDDPAIFADSVSTLLNETRANSAMEIGDNFALSWSQLGLDQQQKIIAQMKSLEDKGMKLRPFLQSYCAVIANAVQIEGADATKITEYLNTAEKVIANANKDQTLKFLNFSASFFKNKALHFERSNKLFTQDANYYFEYVEAPVYEEPEPEVEETSDDEWFDDMDQDYEEDDWNTEWNDDYNDDYYEDYDDSYYEDDYEEQSYEEESFDDPVAMLPMPAIEGAVVRFESVNLNFVTPYDSVFIHDTKGDYLILSNTFVGDGGKFDWSMAGLPADSVYANLSKYSFDVNYPAVKAEETKLNYVGKITDPINGVFEYKSIRHDTTTDARYPRFMSYLSNIRLKNLGPGFIYKGGFALDGAKMKSASVVGEYSQIEVQDKSAKKYRARAKVFEFQDSIITTERASLVIYQGNDSIYHPAVRLKYDIKNQNLTVQKDKGGFRNTPFTSTFFNIDFTADILRWDLKSDSLDASILQARNIVPAYFESSDHYNEEDYSSLGDRVYTFNPLTIVVNYSSKQGLDEFYVEELAKFYKQDKQIIRGAMIGLAQKGLIGFNTQTNLITVKEKARHLYTSKFRDKDYDNIILASVTSAKPNATLNFSKREMTVRGVEVFKLSDSLNVIIQPDSSEITFLKDRDFTFNGKVSAGNFEYIGRDFTFKYDSFLIYLNEIDSIRFYVRDENSRGGNGRRKVDNSLVGADSLSSDGTLTNNLQGSSGTLFINRPNNKSAKVKLPNYPKFDSEKGGVVYFDRKQVLGGVYDKSMYFLVPPFDLDSLGGADASAIAFEGTFVSSGMFPTFKEKLTIQKDFSLGFNHNVPKEGYQLYEGEGRFYNNLTLNKNGIRGDGKIDFLTSSLESKDFVFYPDSVTGSGNYFEIREEEYGGVIFPQASINNYEMHWLPKKDSMYINSVDEPFQFYNQSASLDGTTIVSGGGVFGSGLLSTRGSESESKEITLEHDSFRSRHTQFELKSDNPEKPALYGDDVRVNFDLNDNYALISPEVEGEAAIQFPYAQFNTSITEARWDLNAQKITMKKPQNVPLENSYFYTTREDLDSLAFMATEAVYDINTLELKVSGIPYIIVADAKITPENNEVLILENAKIGQLLNTTIILDTLNGYHRLTEGVINIKSRNEFSGFATYQFVNSENDTIPIKMENFRLEQIPNPNARKNEPQFTTHTVANGSVTEGQNLLVSPGMFFKGDMILYAHQPAMELNGYVKLDMEEPGYNTWIKYSSSADQEEVVIDFDNSTTEEGRKLEAGIHFSAGDNSLYNTFIQEKFSPDDDDFFLPAGHLFYDKIKREFVIEDTAKASGSKLAGQIYRYNHRTASLQYEGKASFIPYQKDFEVLSSVIGTANLNEQKYDLNALLSINMTPVPTQVFDQMAYDFLDIINNLGAPEGLGDPTQLLYKLADLAGERAAKEYEDRSLQGYTPLAGFTKETSASIVLTDVDMKWSVDYKAFYSEGKLGISNFGRADINGAFDGFLEIRRMDDGVPVLNLFIKASPDSWYFFSYEDNRLLIYSSNNAVNDLVSKKSNGGKAKIGELIFAPADKAETLNFINRFRLQYYGIDEIYELDSEIEEVQEELPDDGFGGATEEEEEEEDDDEGF